MSRQNLFSTLVIIMMVSAISACTSSSAKVTDDVSAPQGATDCNPEYWNPVPGTYKNVKYFGIANGLIWIDLVKPVGLMSVALNYGGAPRDAESQTCIGADGQEVTSVTGDIKPCVRVEWHQIVITDRTQPIAVSTNDPDTSAELRRGYGCDGRSATRDAGLSSNRDGGGPAAPSVANAEPSPSSQAVIANPACLRDMNNLQATHEGTMFRSGDTIAVRSSQSLNFVHIELPSKTTFEGPTVDTTTNPFTWTFKNKAFNTLQKGDVVKFEGTVPDSEITAVVMCEVP